MLHLLLSLLSALCALQSSSWRLHTSNRISNSISNRISNSIQLRKKYFKLSSTTLPERVIASTNTTDTDAAPNPFTHSYPSYPAARSYRTLSEPLVDQNFINERIRNFLISRLFLTAKVEVRRYVLSHLSGWLISSRKGWGGVEWSEVMGCDVM